MEYTFKKNLKGSVKAIEKMNREIECHPENEELLNKLVDVILSTSPIKNFRVVKITREDFFSKDLEKEFGIRYNMKLSVGSPCGSLFGFRTTGFQSVSTSSHKEVCFNFSPETDYRKVLSFTKDNELILFVIDQRVKFTKEETKIIKKFLGNEYNL